MPISPQQAWEVLRSADMLYSAEEVEASINEMSERITSALADTNPLLICIMNGGVVLTGKLLPKLQFPLQVDYIHATRYRQGLAGGQLQWMVSPQMSVKDRTVLLVDDILDEGVTLAGIESRFRDQGAKAMYKAVLILKERKRTVNVHIDFPGLTVPNRYVFGYGMDYKGYLRNAPGIYAEGEN
jgi:hypoxanthine phosphoribosyltransferase